MKGIKSIETWDAFKKELKKHFYLENKRFEAYKKHRRLKHEGSFEGVWKGVLFLDVRDTRHAREGVILWFP